MEGAACAAWVTVHGRAETSAAGRSASACAAGMEAIGMGDGCVRRRLPERRLDFGKRKHAERVAPAAVESGVTALQAVPGHHVPGHALHRSAMPWHAVQSQAVGQSPVIVWRKRRAIEHASMHAAPGRRFHRRADAGIGLHVING